MVLKHLQAVRIQAITLEQLRVTAIVQVIHATAVIGQADIRVTALGQLGIRDIVVRLKYGKG